MASRSAILNLIYSYSKHVDDGNFTAVGELFRYGRYEIPSLGDLVLPGTAIGTFFADHLRRYDDGTPRTTHINPNVILDIDDQELKATSWTSILVFQNVEGEIKCIFSGWYDDEFEHVEGDWLWRRRVARSRFAGDMSHHVLAVD